MSTFLRHLFFLICLGLLCTGQLKAQDSLQEAKHYFEEAQKMLRKDFRKALPYADTTILLAKAKSDSLMLRSGYWTQSDIYRRLGRYDSSFLALEQAALYIDSTDQRQLIIHWLNEANTYERTGGEQAALKRYFMAREMLGTLELNRRDSIDMYAVHANIILIYRRSKAYEKAVREAWRGMNYLPERAWGKIETAYINLGNVYMDMGQQDSAQYYYRLVLEQPADKIRVESQFQAHINMANSYGREERHEAAEPHIQKSLALAQKLNSDHYFEFAYAVAGSAYLAQEQYRLGDSLFTQAESYARQLKDTATLILILYDRIKIDKALDQSLSQFRRQRELRELLKKRHQSKRLQAVAELEARFVEMRQEEEKQQQEEALTTRDELLQEQRTQNGLAIAVVFILFMFLLFLGLLAYGKSLEKKELTILTKKCEADLYQSNALLLQYAHLNSHQVRAPLSTFLALVQLLELEDDAEEQKVIYDKLREVGEELRKSIEKLNAKIAAERPPELIKD